MPRGPVTAPSVSGPWNVSSVLLCAFFQIFCLLAIAHTVFTADPSTRVAVKEVDVSFEFGPFV